MTSATAATARETEHPSPPTILCATDLSEPSRHALDAALELSNTLGAACLHVLHVHESVERIDTVQHVVERWEERREKLRLQVEAEILHVNQERSAVPNLKVIAAIHSGKAYREILRYAVKESVSWIVVGTHGRTGLGHVLGSVAERIVRHAPCTVVVAKSPEVCARLAHTLETHHLPP